MTFTSYAQNFEDVMLWRALKHVPNGRYVDVGAQHPVIDSVSKAFYERGWRGVHFEPVPVYAELLRRDRPDETVLEVALSDSDGVLELDVIPETGLSTAVEAFAQSHRQEHGFARQKIQVSMMTLKSALAFRSAEPVHWLKIDVEGLEENVLRGWDSRALRPWIIVIAATTPLSPELHENGSDNLLVEAGYRFVYFDGLNRFYVASEHMELADAFRTPPNVLDRAQLSGLSATWCIGVNARHAAERQVMLGELASARSRLAQALSDDASEIARTKAEAQGRIDQATAEAAGRVEQAEALCRQLASRAASTEARLSQANHRASQAELSAATASNRLEAVTKTASWRMAAPFRDLRSALRKFESRVRKTPLVSSIKRRIKKCKGQQTATPLPATAVAAPVLQPQPTGQYARWVHECETRSDQVTERAGPVPLVSFLVCGSGHDEGLARTIDSIRAQSHGNWEVVLCQPSEPNESASASRIKRLESDSRVVTARSPKGGKAEGLGAAVSAARGTFVAILDSGDVLVPHALNEIAVGMGLEPQADILYSDEDEQSAAGFRDLPYFKPGWSPDLLYAFNYFGRLTLLRRDLVIAAGGIEAEAGAAVEWDVNLRVSDRAQVIVRLAKVLCHRNPGGTRERPAASTPEAADQRAVICRYWAQKGFAATSETTVQGTQRVLWPIENPPLVSIVIPSKDKVELLRVCVDGLLSGTDYPAKEIIIVDTGSDNVQTLSYYDELGRHPEVRIVHFDRKFNYSAACNYGASCAHGEVLLFLNNDIEVVSRDWLQEMVRFALRPGVGCIGAKLVFPNDELQHAGVGIGIHLAALMYRSAGQQGWGLLGSPDHPRNWLAIMGACQMVRRDVFERVGGFDESYLIAMSDVALCLRIWRAGYRVVYTPDAALIHHEGATRGHTNPADDVRRLADDLRLLGIDEDPYLHPEIDGTLAIPTLRIRGAPNVRQILKIRIDADGSTRTPSHDLDLTSDGGCMEVAGMPRQAVIWAPQPAHGVCDIWSAARWCLDLLRGQSEVRARYPLALSSGGSGEFARWLKTEATMRWSLPDSLAAAVDQLFASDISSKARRDFLFEDFRTSMPHGLTPVGLRETFRWFIQRRRDSGLRLEEIWWLMWTAAESPALELVRAHQFTPAWQRLYPDGTTIFGRRAFANWFAATYRATGGWLAPSTWPTDLSAARQIRQAYNARSHWQSRYPLALSHTREGALRLIEWLRSDDAVLPADVRAWCESLETSSVTEELARPGVNVIGHFCYPSGLRVSVEALVGGLHRVDVDTSLRALRTDREDDPEHLRFSGQEDFDVTIIHTQPEPFFNEAYERSDVAERVPRTYRIAFWYWEFDSIPASWATHAAKVDEVWAATEFVAKGLRERLSIPVHTVFPGVKLGPYLRRERSYFGLESDRFTFLFTFHMMSIMERKNPLGLIRAFQSAFRPEEPVNLVLKTSFGDRHPAQIRELHEAAAGSNIKIIDQLYSPDEVLSLMDVCDAYVSLHRSEGLGLTMAEAMLMGKPVIATNYSGNVAFMDETNSLLVNYELVKLGKPIPPYDADSEWAEPSTEHAVQLMRQVYGNQAWARELGARAKLSAELNLSLEASGRKAAARLAEIASMRSGAWQLRQIP